MLLNIVVACASTIGLELLLVFIAKADVAWIAAIPSTLIVLQRLIKSTSRDMDFCPLVLSCIMCMMVSGWV